MGDAQKKGLDFNSVNVAEVQRLANNRRGVVSLTGKVEPALFTRKSPLDGGSGEGGVGSDIPTCYSHADLLGNREP